MFPSRRRFSPCTLTVTLRIKVSQYKHKVKIPTESYESFYTGYSAAIQWMRSLGIDLGSGRTSHYERIVGYWKDSYRTASAEDAKKIFPDFVSSLFEIYDFVEVHKAFKDVPHEQLTSIAGKLQKAVNGPINAYEETPASTTARNYLFEATVAARSHRPHIGIEAILDAQSDTGIRFEGTKLWIECKRTTSYNRIEQNARKATRQLEGVLRNQVGSGHRALVALDVSKLFNPGDQIYVGSDDTQLLSSTRRMMDIFIRDCSHLWQNVYTRRSKKITGTFIRFAFMASSKARNLLVHTSQWAVNPRLGISRSEAELQKRFVSILSSED